MFRVGEEERNSAPSVTTGALWGDSKLAKMAYPGSLASRFVNNDYVTAEIICSTAYVCHEVLTWLWATLCGTPVPAPPIKPWELLLYHSCVRWVSQERREHSVSAAMAAVSARRE